MSTYSTPSGQQSYGTGTPAKPSRTLAIVGFILSFFAVLDIAGLIMSIVAFRRAKRNGEPRGLALAGIIISIITIIGTIITVVLLVTVFSAVLAQCGELGSGTHVIEGVTYTCP